MKSGLFNQDIASSLDILTSMQRIEECVYLKKQCTYCWEGAYYCWQAVINSFKENYFHFKVLQVKVLGLIAQVNSKKFA
jgi:Pyruvate/2-oxoacid:ferredoxin oxidoreductase delta subunit